MIQVGDMTIINWPSASVDDLIEEYGIHPAQIVQDAEGHNAYIVRDLMRDTWYQAMWQAHKMTRDEIALWLTGDFE